MMPNLFNYYLTIFSMLMLFSIPSFGQQEQYFREQPKKN